MEEEYKTCDLYLAASIQASNVKMVKHTQERDRVYFHYNDDQGLVSRVAQDYLSHRLEIDALALVDNIKSLKSFCAEIRRGKGGRRNAKY